MPERYLIRTGRADAVIAGGTEGGMDARREPGRRFVPAVFDSHAGYGLTGGTRDRLRAAGRSTWTATASWSARAAAMVVLESRAHAERRGATVPAGSTGYGSLADGYHPSSPEPNGTWEAEVMRQALAGAGLGPGDVDAIVAHGTSTPKGDSAEIRAINQVYEGTRAAVTSIKGNLGHPSGAAGAQAVVAALCALRDRRAPAHRGHLPGRSRSQVRGDHRGPALSAGHVQVNAFGFGGQNASLVLGAG